MESLKTGLLFACFVGSLAAPFTGSRQCSRQSCNNENSRYEIGQTYTYDYNALSKTWINGTSDAESSLEFNCKAQIDVISPCELVLKLKDVVVMETSSNGNAVPANNQDSMRNELQWHTLRFAFNEGVVTDVCPSLEEKTWALNFKRGFLSTIQAALVELPVDKIEVMTTETDVTGKCPITLSRSEISGSIKKTKNIMKCEQHTKLEGSIQSTMLRPDAPLFHLVKCTQECEVSFDSNIVSEVMCKEQHISKPFSRHNSGAMTHTRSTVQNLVKTPAASTPSSSIIERQTTILYDHDESTSESQHDVLNKAKNLLESIARKLTDGVSPNLFSDLVTEMRKVETTAAMTELKEFIIDNEALFAIFKDALPAVETTPSVDTMVGIINEVATSGDEEKIKAFTMTRAMWLTIPAVIRHPTKEMISAIMPLIKALTLEDTVFYLPISSMINKYCTTENPLCLEDGEVVSAIEYFQSLLGYDCSPTTETPATKMLMALKALTNIRRLSSDSKITIINNCIDIESSSKNTEIRVALLELIRRLPCNPSYQTVAKTMYMDQQFDSELRIMAYRAIMMCPSEGIMEAIKEVMMEEESDQVGSYVWSHLSNLNKTNDPQKQHLKKWVQKSGVVASFDKLDLRKFSRNLEMSWYSENVSSGLTIEGDMMFSPESFLPRQIKANATIELYGYAINLFELGGRLEGIQHFLESIFGPRGYFQENSISDVFREYQEQQQEALLAGTSEVDPNELPDGLPEGLTAGMYSQLLRMLQFQQKIFGGNMPLPSPGSKMPIGMPEGMTQKMYDQLLLKFQREGLPGMRQKRHLIKDSSINDIHSEFPAHVENQPLASLYMKFFGNELGYVDVEKIKRRISEMKSTNVMKMMLDMAKDTTHELSKNAVFLDVSWTVPTIIGLPMKVAINGTITMKVRTEGKVDIRGMLMAPRGFTIDGIIEPSAAIEMSTSMEVTARTTRSGLNHVAHIHSSVSLGGKIKIASGQEVSIQLNVPDQKQEIVDISSTIYLRRQDEAIPMEGIPERMDLSYCSGPLATQYVGIQVCSELAFPKSYEKESYPLFPLTGPGRMLLTIEKTDPSLTSWNFEASYMLQKETVNEAQIKTDRFHFMIGAPDTNIPRIFQADISYNRNDMEMNLNVITPFKTFDVHSKTVNDPMLRKLEVSVTLDKTSVYALDTEVETQYSVVDGDAVINFFPHMDVTSPSGNLLNFRSSIGVRDGQQTRVEMWMSLDSPRTALVTVRGDVVKTESAKKLRYSSDLQITGKYVNVNLTTAWQKRDHVVGFDVELIRRIDGVVTKDVVINAKFSNRTTESKKEWDFKTEWAFASYPFLSFMLESDYIRKDGHSESTSKLCYRYNGQVCDQTTKVIMSHNLNWETSDGKVNETFNFKLRNPANYINVELQQHVVHNTSFPLDFSISIVNNTSEVEVIGIVLHQRSLSEASPIRGDLDVLIRSQNWRYAIHEDWEFAENGKLVSNSALNWADQTATFTMSFIPTTDDETGMERLEFNSLLTYSLGSLSASWFSAKLNKDISSGASLLYNDLSLFAYQIDYTDHEENYYSSPDKSLAASFNISRPASPISVMFRAASKNDDVTGGFNITMGNTKSVTSGLSISSGTGDDYLPKVNMKIFADVDAPRRDIDFGFSVACDMSGYKRMQEHIIRYKGKQIYYYHDVIDTVDSESDGKSIKYESHQIMQHPLPAYETQSNYLVSTTNFDYQYIIHRGKSPILFLKFGWGSKMLDAEGEEIVKEGNVDIHRQETKMIIRTPLVIMKDVSWNTTLDTSDASFKLDSRLIYFPNQERPFSFMINHQNKSSKLVSHNEITASFQTVKRNITLFNMAKFDLGAGTVLGSSSVEFSGQGMTAEKFEMIVEYTNDTKSETKSHSVVLTLNSPDNTIKTENTLMYRPLRQLQTSFSVLVSEEAIFGWVITAQNRSTNDMVEYEVNTAIDMLEEQYRIEMLHIQDDNSYNPTLKVYRNNEQDPIAEVDITYNMVNTIGEIHTVVVTLKSEDIIPVTITTVFKNITDNQNVNVIVATSKDNHMDFDFNLVSSKSEDNLPVYNVTFEIDNTYIPGRKFEVTARWVNLEDEYHLDTDVRISEIDMFSASISKTWETDYLTFRTEDSKIQITLPQLADDPILSNLVLHFNHDDHTDVISRKISFLWGQLTDDEMISWKTTVENSEVMTMVFTHPVEIPQLPKEITFVFMNNRIPSAKLSFEMQLNDADINMMKVVGSYALIDGDEKNRRAMIAFSRPDHPDISVTLDAQVLDGDAVFKTNLMMKYSNDEDKTMEVMLEILNKTSYVQTGFYINMTVKHLATDLDISTALTVLNDQTTISAAINNPEPFNIEIKWDKEEQEYSTISHTPFRKMVFTGRYEDRSYSDYKIFRITMTNTYNDVDEIRSMFEYNSQLKEITYINRFNPDNAEDYWRFKTGYLNESAVVILFDSEIDGHHSIDARLIVALDSPKTLMNHLEWNPEWPEYIVNEAQERYRNIQEEIETRRANFADSNDHFAQRINDAYEDFLTSNEDIKDTWMEIKETITEKVELRKAHMAAFREAWKAKYDLYWSDFKEDMLNYNMDVEALLMDLEEKYSMWANDLCKTSQGYIKTTSQRVNQFYNNDVKPIFEEFKELFDNLVSQYKIQLDILFPEVHTYGDIFFKTPEEDAGQGYEIQGEKEDVVVNSIIVDGEDIALSPEETFVVSGGKQSVRRILIWDDMVRAWNTTKAEFDAFFAQLDTDFKSSVFYADLMARWEEMKEAFPAEQWRQDIQARLEEIRLSDDIQDLVGIFKEIRTEVNITSYPIQVEYTRVRDAFIKAFNGYSLDIADYLKSPTYRLLRKDIENGDILLIIYLPFEAQSLQEIPESFNKVQVLQNIRNTITEVRERSNNALGEITLTDGTVRNMYELMFIEPMLLYREGNLSQWFQGEKIKAMRKFWEVIHLTKFYVNPISWIPPYEANAMIVGSNHYVTFDRTFYDFSGGCSYLLAHDFIDGNFTVIVEYSRDGASSDGRDKSIVLYLNDTNVFEIQKDFTLLHGKQFKELPFQFGRTTVTRSMNSIRIHNTNGITITCNVAHDICNVNITGWYYGKTAGLFGTYNYESYDDFKNSDGSQARHNEDFTRSWKVGRHCSGSSSDLIPECNTDPMEEANVVCSDHFLDDISNLTQCLGVVDPAPYYAMCTSKMCMLAEEDRSEAACKSVKAYVDECNRLMVGISMPKSCVICDSPRGKFTQHMPITLHEPQGEVPQSADVILVIEEKLCNSELMEHISDIVDMLDTDLKTTQEFSDNRFGILGFGGKGIHDLAHIHTIDGAVFNDKRTLRYQGIPMLEFSQDGNNNTFDAILAAAKYPFRTGVAKNIILVSCSNCQYNLETSYAAVSGILLKENIQFNILMNAQLQIVPTPGKSAGSPKNQVIYGIDNRTAFTNKALSTGSLIGDKSLRRLINEPINQCALLAYETGGALFDSSKLGEKKFADVFTQRMLEHTIPEHCQLCRCEADIEGVGRSVCESCSMSNRYSWLFEMDRQIAEARYYARLGMATIMNRLGFTEEQAAELVDISINNTPNKDL